MTKIEADVKNVRFDRSLAKVVVPMFMRGDVDWRWFNAFREEVNRINLVEKEKCHLYCDGSSGNFRVEIRFPSIIEPTPEAVSHQEKIANTIAESVDGIMTRADKLKTQTEEDKNKKLEDAIEKIRHMKD